MSFTYSFHFDNLKYSNLLFDFLSSYSQFTNFYITTNSDNELNTSIVFEAELSSENSTLLTGLMTSYIPPQSYTILYTTENININLSNVSSVTYTPVATYIWIPNKYNDSSIVLDNIKIITKISNFGSYQVRLYDCINNIVLSESIPYNNSSNILLTLDNINNIPTDNSCLELQVLVSDTNSVCTITNILFVYSKIM